MLELLKMIVQPVVLERDADGKILGEKIGEPTAIYGTDELVKFVDTIQSEIQKTNQQHEMPIEVIN